MEGWFIFSAILNAILVIAFFSDDKSEKISTSKTTDIMPLIKAIEVYRYVISSFATGIYSLEGNQKMSTLFQDNLQLQGSKKEFYEEIKNNINKPLKKLFENELKFADKHVLKSTTLESMVLCQEIHENLKNFAQSKASL